MSVEKAFTYVDVGSARVGNRWAERRWSAFLGQTVELQFPAAQWEWTASPSPEFRLLVEDKALGFMDLGTVQWAEECDSFGATLVATYTGAEIELLNRFTFFHYHPGALRRSMIFNASDRPLKLRELCLDILRLKPDTVVEAESTSLASARTFGKTVFCEFAAPARVEIAGNDLCGLVEVGGYLMQPGERLVLPETRMLFSHNPPDKAMLKEWTQFRDHLEQYRQAEEEALRLRGLEE